VARQHRTSGRTDLTLHGHRITVDRKPGGGTVTVYNRCGRVTQAFSARRLEAVRLYYPKPSKG
jgi:hypothetical protein